MCGPKPPDVRSVRGFRRQPRPHGPGDTPRGQWGGGCVKVGALSDGLGAGALIDREDQTPCAIMWNWTLD